MILACCASSSFELGHLPARESRDLPCRLHSTGDNAVDVHGVSIVPGSTGGSRHGPKIAWSAPTDDADTFVEASWAHNPPRRRATHEEALGGVAPRRRLPPR